MIGSPPKITHPKNVDDPPWIYLCIDHIKGIQMFLKKSDKIWFDTKEIS